MSNVASVTLKWDTAKINLANKNAVQGMFKMGFDIASQARRNAPYVTGALRNTIHVDETGDKSLEVIAGGDYGGKVVDYAMKREEGPNKNPETEHYMENALKTITSGDYLKTYFGNIL